MSSVPDNKPPKGSMSHFWGLCTTIGARAGIATGVTLSGPSLASWFFNRKLGEGYKGTLDQSD